MFPIRYFTTRMFAARYWPKVGAAGATPSVVYGRLDYTVPKNLLHYRVPDSRLEYTVPKRTDFDVPQN